MNSDLISITVENVEKRFRTVLALNQISLQFEAATMHGVIGPEGAGKTTLMRVILSLLRPNSGKVRFFESQREVALEQVRPKVAYMPQQQSLYPDLSIEEHLEFFRDLYEVSPDVYQRKSEELLRMTRLKDFVKRPAGQLSGGMYKKLGLMCALLRSPSAVLLDEPTNGVDPISRREFWELLYGLADQKILIIVSTAYMDEAERCSRIHLMDSGRVVTEGEPRELLKREGVRTFDELFLRYGASS